MTKLKREFGIIGGMAMVACTMIGSGIFMAPLNVVTQTNSFEAALYVWTISGIMALFGLQGTFYNFFD